MKSRSILCAFFIVNSKPVYYTANRQLSLCTGDSGRQRYSSSYIRGCQLQQSQRMCALVSAPPSRKGVNPTTSAVKPFILRTYILQLVFYCKRRKSHASVVLGFDALLGKSVLLRSCGPSYIFVVENNYYTWDWIWVKEGMA